MSLISKDTNFCEQQSLGQILHGAFSIEYCLSDMQIKIPEKQMILVFNG